LHAEASEQLPGAWQLSASQVLHAWTPFSFELDWFVLGILSPLSSRQ
jgi:hypothetical protein